LASSGITDSLITDYFSETLAAPSRMSLLVYLTCVTLAGLVLGSFAGCCIYRLPRGISLWNPARSFCPRCGATLKASENIPVLSWLVLRGRCGHCQGPVSIRYLLVELLTPALFVAFALRISWPTVIAEFALALLLVIATFVDLEFLLIPDELTYPGVALGLVLSFFLPSLHQTSSGLVSTGLSLAGCLVGASILYLVSESGKLIFGRYKILPPHPIRFSLENSSTDNPRILLDGEPFDWATHFLRSRDKILVRATEVTINGEKYQNLELRFFHDRLKTARHDLELTEIRDLYGRTNRAEFPREAMGLGDVKLIAAIGTFVGWQGILFTIPIAAFLGCLFGAVAMLMRQKSLSVRVPFGPFLSAGAVLWILCGPELVGLYERIIGLQS
jgi:leader peptidase (prepilin peptidase) / N-methyltransferase